MITKELLVQKRDEYRAAYMEHLGIANANHGAMQAMEDLIAELDRDDQPAPTEPQDEGDQPS